MWKVHWYYYVLPKLAILDWQWTKPSMSNYHYDLKTLNNNCLTATVQYARLAYCPFLCAHWVIWNYNMACVEFSWFSTYYLILMFGLVWAARGGGWAVVFKKTTVELGNSQSLHAFLLWMKPFHQDILQHFFSSIYHHL